MLSRVLLMIAFVMSVTWSPEAAADGCRTAFQDCIAGARADYQECRLECRDGFFDCVAGCSGLSCYADCIDEGFACLDECGDTARRAREQCLIEGEECRSCTDGSPLLCDSTPPDCSDGTILTITQGCWECVDPDTCEPPPNCDDGTPLICDQVPPECPDGTMLALQDGCWECVDPETCEPPCRDDEFYDDELGACCPTTIFIEDCLCVEGTEIVTREIFDDNGCLIGIGCECLPLPCSDGTDLLCDAVAPECPDGTVLTVQNGCWSCVDPDTCEVPCADDEYFDIELETCCPQAVYAEICSCDPDTEREVREEVLDDAGCLLGSDCECVPIEFCPDGTLVCPTTGECGPCPEIATP